MAADRVPQPGEVWVLRHLHQLGRGRVTILDPADAPAEPGVVVFRYHGTGSTGSAGTVEAFVTMYDWLAVDEQSCDLMYGPQLRPGVRRLEDMGPRLGTAVD